MKEKDAALQEPAVGDDLGREGIPEVVMLELRSAKQTREKVVLPQSCHARALCWEGAWELKLLRQKESWRGENRVWCGCGWREDRTSRALPY